MAASSHPVFIGNGNQFRIRSREEWGARLPPDPAKQLDLEKQLYTRFAGPGLADEALALRQLLSGIVIHHTAFGFGTNNGPLQIQSYEMDSRGWSDIGYHYFIDKTGLIFEGRKLRYIGAHAGQTVEANAVHNLLDDPDFGNIGIVLEGDFFTKGVDNPQDVQKQAMGRLIMGLMEAYPNIFPLPANIMTHSDVQGRWIKPRGLTEVRPLIKGKDISTECPGDRVKEWLDDFVGRLEAGRNFAGGKHGKALPFIYRDPVNHIVLEGEHFHSNQAKFDILPANPGTANGLRARAGYINSKNEYQGYFETQGKVRRPVELDDAISGVVLLDAQGMLGISPVESFIAQKIKDEQPLQWAFQTGPLLWENGKKAALPERQTLLETGAKGLRRLTALTLPRVILAKEKNNGGQGSGSEVFVIIIREPVTLWDAQDAVKRFLPRLESAIVLGDKAIFESEHNCKSTGQDWPFGFGATCTAPDLAENGHAIFQVN